MGSIVQREKIAEASKHLLFLLELLYFLERTSLNTKALNTEG